MKTCVEIVFSENTGAIIFWQLFNLRRRIFVTNRAKTELMLKFIEWDGEELATILAFEAELDVSEWLSYLPKAYHQGKAALAPFKED